MSHTRFRSVILLILGCSLLQFLGGCHRQLFETPFPFAANAASKNSYVVRERSDIPSDFRRENAGEDSRALSAEVEENLARGDAEAAAGRPFQAARFYERILRDDPGHADAHQRLAVLSDGIQDFEAAERHYLAALRQHPDDPDLLNDLGYSYLLSQRYADAEQQLRRAVQLKNDHRRAVANLALLYVTVGSRDRALEVLAIGDRTYVAEMHLAQLDAIVAANDQVVRKSSPPQIAHNRGILVREASAEGTNVAAARNLSTQGPSGEVDSAASGTTSDRVALLSATRDRYVRRAPELFTERAALPGHGGMPIGETSPPTANTARANVAQPLPLWTVGELSESAERSDANATERPPALPSINAGVRTSRNTTFSELPGPFFSEGVSSGAAAPAKDRINESAPRQYGVLPLIGHTDP